MMRDDGYRAAMEDVIYLSRCAVNGLAADKDRVASMDLRQLFTAANRHMMAAVTGMGLESAGIRDEAFRQAENRAIRKSIALDAELACLSSRLEAAGIWYMPLKGTILKTFYPRFGMREMADCDILFDETRSDEIRVLLKGMGYTLEDYRIEHHDVFIKPPLYVFEMHRRLFDYDERMPVLKYYADVKSRLIPDAGNPWRYHFSPEDFYVYMLAHEYKHYSDAGSGLRSCLDVYVYWKKFGASMNRAYLAGELEKLELTVFEKQTRELALALFGDEEMSEEGRDMLENHLFAGTFGNQRNKVAQRVKELGGGRRGRFRYLLKRLWIPKEEIREVFPFFWKHKILLPLLPPFRMIRGAVLFWPRVSQEMKAFFLHQDQASTVSGARDMEKKQE